MPSTNARRRGVVAAAAVAVVVLALLAPVAGAETRQQLSVAQAQAEAQAMDASAMASGYRAEVFQVGGTYIPLVGDFDGDGVYNENDILWYAPGGATDYYWDITVGANTFTKTSTTTGPINGHYEPFVFDFDTDGQDDIFWYAPGSARDYVWFGVSGGGFNSVQVSVNGHYTPIPTYVGTDAAIYWYGEGTATDHLWVHDGSPGDFSNVGAHPVNGVYWPVPIESHTGDAGILWYGPGGRPDHVWSNVNAAAPPNSTDSSVTINGYYEPVSQYSSVILYGAGDYPDYLAGYLQPGTFSFESLNINGYYIPGASPFVGNVVWHAPGAAHDYFWWAP